MARSMTSLLLARVTIHVSPSCASIRPHTQPAPGSEPAPGSHAYAKAMMRNGSSFNLCQQLFSNSQTDAMFALGGIKSLAAYTQILGERR